MTVLYLLLDALGGILIALAVFLLLRLIVSYQHKYKFEGKITSTDVSDGHMHYTVSFDVDGKPQEKKFSIPLSTDTKKAWKQQVNFSNGFRKWSKYVLMSKTPDGSSGFIPEDRPKKMFIIVVLLLLAFHTSAYLAVEKLLFSLSL